MSIAVCLVGSCIAQHLSPKEQSTALSAIHSITVPAVRGHMRFLSDELLAGRAPGTAGYDIAARYVATQMEAMGLLPAGEQGTYFQRVPMRESVNAEAKSSLILIRDGKEVRLKSRVDYLYGGNLIHTESSAF